MKEIWMSLTVLLFFSNLILAGELEWKPVSGVNGYQIIIENRQTHKVIINKQVKTNSFPIHNLKPGNYRVRIAPLDILHKPLVWSNWKNVELIRKNTPEISNQSIVNLEQGKGKQEITIHGKGFQKDSRVLLVKKKKEYALNIKQVQESKIQAELNTDTLKPGVYGLKIKSQYSKEVYHKRFLTIKKEAPPLETLSPKENERVVLKKGEPLYFVWKKDKDAKYYEFRILQGKKNSRKKELLKDKVEDNKYHVKNLKKLKEGNLVWEVKPFDKKGRPGKASQSEFEIQLKKKNIKPDDIKVISPDVLYVKE